MKVCSGWPVVLNSSCQGYGSTLDGSKIHTLLVHFKVVSWEPDFYHDAGSSFCSCASSLWSTGRRWKMGRRRFVLTFDVWPLSILAPEVMKLFAPCFLGWDLPTLIYLDDTGNMECRIVTGWSMKLAGWNLGSSWPDMDMTQAPRKKLMANRCMQCGPTSSLPTRLLFFGCAFSSSKFMEKHILNRKTFKSSFWWFQIDINNDSWVI